MAKPPKQHRLVREDTDADRAQNVDSIGRHMDAAVQCLTSGLTISENVLGRVIKFPFTAPTSGPFRIATGLSQAPEVVLLAGLWRTAPTREAISIPDTFTWDFVAGNLVTSSFAGIAGTDSYLAHLLLIQR